MENGEEMSTEFDPNATPECDAFFETPVCSQYELDAEENGGKVVWETIARNQERRARRVEEQLRIVVEELQWKSENSGYCQLAPEEARKVFELYTELLGGRVEWGSKK
jgi:hypothetical protein